MSVPADVQRHHLRLIAERNGLRPTSFALPEARDLTVGGLRLHYLDWGEPAPGALPVVLLHGGGLNAHTWDLICLMLRDRYHCIALDQRGHGDSEWSSSLEYSHQTQADDIEGLLDTLALRSPLLIGMSMGGLNSIEVAARRSAKLSGLVLVDVGPRLRRQGTERIRAFVSEDAILPSVEDFVERALRFNPRRDRGILRTSLLHNLRQLPDGNWTWKYDRRHIGASPPAAYERRMRDLSARLRQIKCPTLVMRGARSDVFGDDDARALVGALENARAVTVPNAGHTIQGDNPAGFLAALEPFLFELADTAA